MLYNKRTFLPAPEDLIVNKISYGTEQDINDARSIIRRHRKKLDYDYLSELARIKNVLSKLQELLEE